MDVFGLRQRLVDDYADFTRSFVVIRDGQISARVDEELAAGLLWPHPIVQLNPAFEPGGTIVGSRELLLVRAGRRPTRMPGSRSCRCRDRSGGRSARVRGSS